MGKKILAYVLSLLMLVQIAPLSVFADEMKEKEISAELIWNINADGVLSIDGEGEMPEMEQLEGGVFPWYNQKNNITSVVFSDNITKIADYAFAECYALQTVTLPESLENVGNNVFENCVAIEEIMIPNSVKSIASEAFFGCMGLKTVTLGESLSFLGQRAFDGCEKLESIILPEKINALSSGLFQNCTALKNVKLPAGLKEIGSNVFKKCGALEQIEIPESVTSIGFNAFYDCGTDSAESGIVLAVYLDSYAEEYAKAENMNYVLVGSATTSVSVTDAEGVKLTEGFYVQWYQDEEMIATGTTLSNVKTGMNYSYEVILDEELGYIYKQPQKKSFTGNAEDTELICVLEKYPAVTITGQVVCEDETVPEGVGIMVKQSFGAYEKETECSVDSEGNFSMEVLSVSTKLTIYAPGFYSKEISFTEEDLKEEKNVGVIILKALSENKIEISLIKEKAVRPQETPYQIKLVSFDDMTVILKNKTQDKEIKDFYLQYPYIIINDKEVSVRDQIEILVEDQNQDWKASPVLVSLGAEKQEIILKENGKIEAFAVTGNTENMAMLFYEDGSFYASYRVKAGFTTAPIPEGTYKMVWMQKTNLLTRVKNIEKLSSFGLIEGEDYVVQTIDVKKGVISVVENISVPVLDENKLCYAVDENTGFTAAEKDLVVGDCLMLRAAYEIPSKYKSVNEELMIQIPQYTEILEGSVTLNGGTVPYTVENNILRLKTEERMAVVRFYLMVKVAGSFCADAEISFTTNDTLVTQPIGSVDFYATDAKIYVPETTLDEKITVTGKTLPDSIVRIFADGTLKETVSSNKKGSYTAEITLKDVYYQTYHEVYAEIENKSLEGTIKTDTATVVYCADGVEISDVTMYHNGEKHVFDFIRPGKKEYYVPANDNFTFVIKFNGNTKMVKDVVLHVFDVQGNVHRVIPNYDSEKDLWMVACKFTRDEAPVNVNVAYKINEYEEDKVYSATAHPMAAENNKAFVSAWSEAYEDILNAEIKEEDEKSVTIGVYFKAAPKACFDIIVEELAYDSLDISALKESGFSEIVADNKEEKPIYTKWELKDKNLVYTLVDTELLYAYKYTMDSIAECVKDASEESTDALFLSVWDVLASFPVDTVPKTAAVTDFYQLMKFKNEKYTAAQNRMAYITEMISAKCVETGKPQLTEEEKKAFTVRMEQMQITLDSARERFENESAMYQNKIEKGGILNLLMLGLGNIVSSSGEFMQALKNSKNGIYTKYTMRSAELRKNLHITTGGVWDVTTDLSQYIEGATADFDISEASYWSDIKEVYSNFDMLCSILEKDISACFENGTDDDKTSGFNKKKGPAPDKNPMMDPSGYVYEAVPSNRLEGVKAEIYSYDYPLDKNGKPEDEKENILWEAENYDQTNPIYTDENGQFRWNVPQGQWLVKFTKSGYTATDSSKLAMAEDGYLPVPPPQTDVNVGMVSKSAPTVESVEAYKDGVIIFFSQYMNIKSVEKAVSVVYSGKEIEGKAGPINAEYDYEDEERYASQFVFIPETTLKGTVIVTVTDTAENYAGKELKNDFTVTTKIVNEPTEIETEEEVKVAYNSSHMFTVSVTPVKAGANRMISVKSHATDIVGVITHEVKTDEEGEAVVMLEGKLPGTTTVTISVIGSLLSEDVEVTVLPVTDSIDACARVTASVETGEEVEKGTKVSLSTETKDATIYYTLDGTSPCDTENKARKKYTKSITIEEDMLLIAYAVKEGMKDSALSGFLYRVEQEYERVEKPTASPVGGKVASGTTVKLSCKTKNATIYYTTNGSTPTEASKVYTTAIKITKATTIKAIAVKEGMRTSAVMIENYTIKTEEKPAAGGGGGGATGGSGTTGGTVVGENTQALVTPPQTTPQAPADIYVPTGKELYNFRDVTKDQWFYAPIKYAVDKKLFSGISDTEFAPNNLITRAMMVTVLHRADNSPAAQYAITYYDVDLQGYYTPAVRWATAASIVKGYSVTEFGTNDNITREQIAAIMYRYAQYKGYDTSAVKETKLTSYTDASEVSDYAVAAMQYCVGSGLMKGKTETTLNPKDNATRAEIAAILQRMIENNKAE